MILKKSIFNMKKLGCGLLLLAGLGLAGCGQIRSDANAMYDFIYDSADYSRDPYTREEAAPVLGAELQLTLTDTEEAKNVPQLVDAAGQPVLTITGIGGLPASRNINLCMRAEAGLGQTIWFSAEQWVKDRYNGYVDGRLRGGQVCLVSSADGKVLFQAATQPGELFLTACGTRCYFYSPGKTSRRRADWRQAQIYWRDMFSWPLPHTVCSFDYFGSPQLTDGEGEPFGVDRLRFYIRPEDEQSAVLRLDFTCYEQTDVEHDRWNFVVKDSVTVPLQPGWPLPQAEPEEAEPTA